MTWVSLSVLVNTIEFNTSSPSLFVRTYFPLSHLPSPILNQKCLFWDVAILTLLRKSRMVFHYPCRPLPRNGNFFVHPSLMYAFHKLRWVTEVKTAHAQSARWDLVPVDSLLTLPSRHIKPNVHCGFCRRTGTKLLSFYCSIYNRACWFIAIKTVVLMYICIITTDKSK